LDDIGLVHALHEHELHARAIERAVGTALTKRGLKETARLFLFSAVLSDVHDLVLKDKKVRPTIARQPHHVPVVVFDPATKGLAVHELDGNWLLLFPKRFEEGCFLERVFRRRSPAAFRGVGIALRRAKGHAGIVHKRPCSAPLEPLKITVSVTLSCKLQAPASWKTELSSRS